jgi:tetratricopeptide (TPR) repeat protein
MRTRRPNRFWKSKTACEIKTSSPVCKDFKSSESRLQAAIRNVEAAESEGVIMKTRNLIKLLFSICFLSVSFGYILIPIRAAEKPSLIAEIKSGDEKFDRIFREARELFDKEEWAKAAAKFNEIVCDCPEKSYVDSAFYWLAYSYKKQKMYQEANQTIDRLLKNFPNSSWADDARVLRYEAAVTISGIATAPGQNFSRVAVPRVPPIAQTNIFTEVGVGEVYGLSQKVQLDREDELKLAAFQSLIANDPKKGVEAVGRLLQSTSKASETLKREVLRSLRGSRFITSRYPTNGFATAEVTPTVLVTQINPILREILVKGFQTESNLNIRSEIIYSIANINDEQSYTFLAQLYPNESNKDLKKVIINSFVSGPQSFISGQAYSQFEYWNGSTWANNATELATVQGSTTGIVGANQTPKTNPIRELRFNSLMTIFRNEKDLELRRLAFGNIQRFAGWSTRDGMIDNLSQLYDSETDEQFKISIIYSFSNLSKNQQATSKLLDIAKNDKSDKIRLEAIRALRNNKSPEAIKFLEDLIQ